MLIISEEPRLLEVVVQNDLVSDIFFAHKNCGSTSKRLNLTTNLNPLNYSWTIGCPAFNFYFSILKIFRPGVSLLEKTILTKYFHEKIFFRYIAVKKTSKNCHFSRHFVNNSQSTMKTYSDIYTEGRLLFL